MHTNTRARIRKRRYSSRNAGTVKEGAGAHAYKLEPETKRYEYAIQESRTTRRTHPPAHFSRYAGMSDTSGTCGTWTRWMQVVTPPPQVTSASPQPPRVQLAEHVAGSERGG